MSANISLYLLLLYLGNSVSSPRGFQNCRFFHEIIDCKNAGCEYNLVKKICQGVHKECHFDSGMPGCRRGHAFYSEAGVVFHTRKLGGRDVGECSTQEIPFALNLGYGLPQTDSRGIYHSYDSATYYTDVNQTRHAVTLGTKCLNGIQNVSKMDVQIYSYQIRGKTSKQLNGGCLVYHAQLRTDGKYELNIRTVESFYDSDIVSRHFNIRINDMTVVPEFNIRNYVNVCEPLELIIEFQLKDNILIIAGFPGQVTYNRKVNVGFCYGGQSDNSATDPSYLISALYIARMDAGVEHGNNSCFGDVGTTTPNQDCDRKMLNSNSILCKANGCVHSESTCRCNPIYKSCPNEYGVTGCRRPGSFYNKGGRLCYNKLSNTTCFHNKTVIAVNLGCSTTACGHTDSRGITHVTDSNELYRDSWVTRVEGNLSHSTCSKLITGAPKMDDKIFEHYISGNISNAGHGRCINYPVDISEEGRYEISVKLFAEDPQLVKRKFAVRFHDINILQEFDAALIGRLCTIIEIITEFLVTNRVLQIYGFRGQNLPHNRTIYFELCYGNEKPFRTFDPSYLISSFYIAKIGNDGTCGVHNFTEDFKTAKKVFKPLSTKDVVGDQNCSKVQINSSSYPCSNVDCLFSSEMCQCIPKSSECEFKHSLTGCRRGKSFYYNGLSVCYNPKDTDLGNCKHEQLVFGVNIGCNQDKCLQTDSRGIVYQPDRSNNFRNDEFTEFQLKSLSMSCTGGVIPAGDQQLYSSFVASKIKMASPKKCINYQIESLQTGKYEIVVKALTPYGSMEFDILLNDVTLVRGFNSRTYVGTCSGMDLISEFEVIDGLVAPSDQIGQLIPIPDNVRVSFCFEHNPEDALYSTTFIPVAFYLAKMAGSLTCDSECMVYNREPVECIRANCEYSVLSGVCQQKPDDCTQYESVTGCRRSNAHYGNAGIICKSTIHEDQGDCSIKSVLLAVSFCDESPKDSRGITYLDGAGIFSDSSKTKRNFNSSYSECSKTLSHKDVDKFLHTSQIIAERLVRMPGRCIYYHTTIAQDGLYELSIKTAETNAYPNLIRHFNIRINDLVVLAEFSILRYVQACEELELIIEFEVNQGVLKVAGFPDVHLDTDRGLAVGFCYGDGKPSYIYNPNYLVSAFYIALMK